MDDAELECKHRGLLATETAQLRTDTFITAGCRMEIWSLPVKYLDLSDRGISIVTPCCWQISSALQLFRNDLCTPSD